MKRYPRHLAFVLMLLVAFTGEQLAIARGQVVSGPTMILCIGGGLVAVPMDAQGQPAGPGHVCPDGAFAFVALTGALPLAPPAQAVHRTDWPVPATRASVPRFLSTPPARAPPLSA